MALTKEDKDYILDTNVYLQSILEETVLYMKTEVHPSFGKGFLWTCKTIDMCIKREIAIGREDKAFARITAVIKNLINSMPDKDTEQFKEGAYNALSFSKGIYYELG